MLYEHIFPDKNEQKLLLMETETKLQKNSFELAAQENDIQIVDTVKHFAEKLFASEELGVLFK